MGRTVRYAADGDYPRVARFFDQHWAKDHVYARDPKLFEWTFRRSGYWDQTGYSFALAESDGEITGILGAIPFLLNVRGQTSRALWLANFMVRPEHRRGPVAIQLLRMFDRPPYEAVIAFRISEVVTPLYEALHWQVLPDIPRNIAVMPGAEERMTRFLRIAKPGWSGERMRSLISFFRLPSIERLSVDPRQCVPPSWDEHDWPALATKRVGAARNRDYLTWRYTQHPTFKYRIVAIPDGRRTGLAIWRLETIRYRSGHGMTDLDRIARLVEFMPSSSDNAEQLVRGFYQQAMAHDAMAADFYGYYSEIRGELNLHGFKCVEGHPDGHEVPSRFQPLDGGSSRIPSALRLRNGVPRCSLNENCDWYWTKSDGDQDRPN